MTDAEFIERLRKRLASASTSDRKYERPMTWDEADRLLAVLAKLSA